MKKEIKQTEIKKLNRYSMVFSILLIATIISAVPLAVWLGFYAFIPWGVLFAVTMFFAFRTEKIKKDNQLRTYKEIVKFVERKRLDELETQQETGKLPYQRFLIVLGVGLISLIVCLVLAWSFLR